MSRYMKLETAHDKGIAMSHVYSIAMRQRRKPQFAPQVTVLQVIDQNLCLFVLACDVLSTVQKVNNGLGESALIASVLSGG